MSSMGSSVPSFIVFLARKSRYQGTKGEKCKTKPERRDRKTGKQKMNPPKVERLVIQRANWGTGQRKCPCARPPARRQSIAEKTWLGLVLSLSGFQLGSKQQSVNITRENTSRH